MGRFKKIILILDFEKYFNNCVTIRILVLLIPLCVINFYLFYNLKNVNRVQNTIFIPKNETDLRFDKVAEKHEEMGTYIGEVGCITLNSSELFYNKILQMGKELDEFYFIKPNSTEISKRCKRFEETLVQNNLSVTLNKATIQDYFTNGQLIKILKNATLLNAFNTQKGTQLKLLLHLSNGMSAVFKPKWFPIDEVLFGLFHFRGRDRPLGEVMAFYVSILLGFKNVPVATMRKLDINELLRVSNEALSNTFVFEDKRVCFYGTCFFCDRSNLICPDSSNSIEGSMVIHLPPNYGLTTNKHPWARSYKCNTSAMWEVDDNYCEKVAKWRTFVSIRGKNTPLFFDLMDASIFDFLIDNGDRHHYEYITNNYAPRMILLDNGRGMGNPDIDHIDILAPLFQCCFLRNSTWNTLLGLRGGNLSYWLHYLIASNSNPEIILTEKHFKAFDRRLLIIFAVLEDCFRKKGRQKVILND